MLVSFSLLLVSNPIHFPRRQMKIDIKMYDIDMAKLIRGPNDTFRLHCPGLAEARPSVLKGDKLTLSMNGRGYEAEVSRVELEVRFSFSSSFAF